MSEEITLREFIRTNRIRMDVEYTDENKNAPDWTDAYHYQVTLKRGRKQMTTYYSMGYAHTNEPKADDVLDCLAMDASGVENARDFEDWCGEYGYDIDSRKAEKIYKACLRGARQLKQFLGEELYNTLLWNTERM